MTRSVAPVTEERAASAIEAVIREWKTILVVVESELVAGEAYSAVCSRSDS